MTNNLTGRIAVVTGASSGIGAATARRLAAEGAKVALLGRRKDRLEELAAEIGAQALAVEADVAVRQSVLDAAATVRAAFGPVDLVVANAGVMLAAPFESAQADEWDRMVGTNVNGLLYTGRAFIDDLLAAAGKGERADLVNVGSIGGHMVFPNYSVYTATKAAVAHLTRNMRAEFGPRGVRVKNIEPGLVSTELGDGMADQDQKAGLAEWRAGLETLVAGDIADAIAYAVAAPHRMNVAEMIVVPTQQG
ncbi:NADP-dependent 3-hydroxy acid dehydrogenase YdfG [Nocardia tenerifensis]|uniref:NADP-dependent 3-hydroxy acid dehydrogenase YdfG n=1 Tax=Nocardia tenerifensis TaxID=228006 RepID=A0A318KDM2_9NOCA|nr:SDR family oxidoreductase [Nocardia tenerifensis]PXX69180.1 NADP-dependent 3-hydroxy acid dehydrogenase YdfG [Nocardia tenerifensis]